MIKVSDEIDDHVHGRRRTIALLGKKFPWPFPIASGLRGSSATVFGWPVYGASAPAYVKKAHRFFYKMNDIRYWLIYRLIKKHQYHIVRTDLKPGYYDVDTVMLHACMKLLCHYIEDECGGSFKLNKFTQELRKPGSEGHGPREVVERQADYQSEAVEIYHWWKFERPSDLKRQDELLTALYGNRHLLTKPTEHPQLHELVFDEFKGHELEMENELRNLERKIDNDEQSMLHRLIDIRKSLWT